MKKIASLISVLLYLTLVTSCDKTEPPQPETSPYNLKLYRPTNSLPDNLQLQATLIHNKNQLSALGKFDPNNNPELATSFHIYDHIQKAEGIILLDDAGEPAFVYQVNAATGVKLPGVAEFERIDATHFYLRLFHYDWQNRLGTLLFETIMSDQNGELKSNPTFQIKDPSFTGGRVAFGKRTQSFATPLMRLELLSRSRKGTSNTKRVGQTTNAITDFVESFNQMRNSDIAQLLNKTKNGGLTLASLGVGGVLIGAPVGSTLLLGGVAVALVSQASKMVISDEGNQFFEKVKEISDFNSLFNKAHEIGNSTVTASNGYLNSISETMSEGYAALTVDYSDLEEWLNALKENLLIENVDLDDLPTIEGVLQIGMSWNTNGTDIDLWVTDPAGERVYYGNPQSASGGYLDRDNTEGYGPENIYWVENIPDGAYKVQVHYYAPSDGPSTTYTLKVVNGLGFVKTFQGVLQSQDALQTVVTINKSGETIVIQ